ncbi:hypothetical protein K435DRAFT_866393 [Dendrothele bispora CBS 962.96]|uniref:Uncharacterized protein n=1 Tax=Dendrothele bispora (strain CBS 962.96) TaxID=1314807 RepID=A0A4S8LHQ1_DENBC|nr:hypothetical protein K435DRAFT_866393 [Dendrothele bispora CBS 962.96]
MSSCVEPRKGRFTWNEVNPEDASFLADPRRGCSPHLYTEVVSTARASQVNYHFYLLVTGTAAGIYVDWGLLKSSINTQNDIYKGFNDKSDLLRAYRWYCLHYHRHTHDSEYDSFVYPFDSPPSSLVKYTSPSLPASVISSPIPSPTKGPSSKSRSASPVKVSSPKSHCQAAIDLFMLMGNAFHKEKPTPPLLKQQDKGKGKERATFRHWAVHSDSSCLITPDWVKAEVEYLRLVFQGNDSVVMFGTDDLEAATQVFQLASAAHNFDSAKLGAFHVNRSDDL